MDLSFVLLIFISLVSLQYQVSDASTSVFFIDSPTHNYFRSKVDSISLPEISATVSVLLGFAPPSTFSPASSVKLNEVLVPNPFDRPRAAFMLEVTGAEDSQLLTKSDNNVFGSALKSLVSAVDSEAHIQLSDEDVSVFSMNEDSECSDIEINDFASLLGGSYLADALKPLNGELIIPMADGAQLRLHLAKDVERKFVTSLVSLMTNIQKLIKSHQDISQSEYVPTELITAKFDGIQALQKVYGTEGVAQQGLELFGTTVSNIFELMQREYRGQIVGVILSTGDSLPDSKNMLRVESTSRGSSRSLKEQVSPLILLEVALVRKSIAWITGIILLVATLLGIALVRFLFFITRYMLSAAMIIRQNVCNAEVGNSG
ncbi:hypothetical protein LIER_26820 [Lithospermum erythrorhizon]|uniref:DUF7794 domain-containing protein n=1 Tax=Lithospermum erythrorhizon TaxID=34254 RepID=A0AAV3RD00_LITER